MTSLAGQALSGEGKGEGGGGLGQSAHIFFGSPLGVPITSSLSSSSHSHCSRLPTPRPLLRILDERRRMFTSGCEGSDKLYVGGVRSGFPLWISAGREEKRGTGGC